MELTKFGDSIVMTANSKKYRERLFATVDTTNSGYVASVEWAVVSPETIGTGANAKTRIRRVPLRSEIRVPFSLGNALAKSTLTAFFSGLTDLNLPTGVTALQELQEMEPIGSIKAAINSIVNIVETPDSEDFPSLIDEDMSDVE